jgi:hypothetical protein
VEGPRMITALGLSRVESSWSIVLVLMELAVMIAIVHELRPSALSCSGIVLGLSLLSSRMSSCSRQAYC